ncbi:MAG: hypothetical protein ACT4QA_23295 [Panacagrimonas sp.]
MLNSFPSVTRISGALRSTLPAALLGLAWASVTPMASAISDSGNYTGAACQPLGNQADIRYGTFGEATNSSTTSARSVVCPLRTDSNLANAGGFVTLRKHTTASTSCTLHYRRFDAQSGVTQTRSTSGSGFREMSFFLPGFLDGQIHYICSLPAASGGSNTGIISFELDQN